MGTQDEVLEQWNKWFDDEVGYMTRDEPERFADVVLSGTMPFEEQLTAAEPR